MVSVVGIHRSRIGHADPVYKNMFLQVVQKTAFVRFRICTGHGNASRVRHGFAGIRCPTEFRRHQRSDAYQLFLFRASFA